MPDSNIPNLPNLLPADTTGGDLLYVTHYDDGTPTDRKLVLSAFLQSNNDQTLAGSLTLDRAVGTPLRLSLRSGGESRWAVERTAAAETGSNVGSDLILNAFDDDGGYLRTQLRFDRNNGTFNVFTPFAAVSATFSGAVTTNGNVVANGGFRANGDVRISRAAGSAGAVNFATNGATRWAFEKTNEAESGSNNGSNLVLNRFNDAGGYLGTLFSFSRSSGEMSFFGNVNIFQRLVIPDGTPASASASGTQGQLMHDDDYIYIATADNTWKRVAVSSW